MSDFFLHLLDASGFPPRWHCGSWTPGHGWLHILSDLGVWAAYVAIPLVLGFFALRKRDLPFRNVFWLFGAFIFACGTTHLMEAIIFWWPAYRLAGMIKLFTALVSWGTVIALVPITPKALALRSPQELEREIAARKEAQEQLERMHQELEQRVQLRTAELAAVANDNARLNRELRDADRRKDEFLAMLAHELRNPLAPVHHSLALFRTGQTDAETVALMERQVEHMVRLVDDLLDVSRITRGKIELKKEPVAVATVVQRAIETARPAIAARNQHLQVSLPDAPVWLNADTTRLVQVFANLLDNAAKYSDPGATIWVSVTRDDDTVELRVRDQGRGISSEVLPHIFELFMQGDQSLDRSQGGLGIGLSLVRGLVEMHDGAVEVHSAGPNSGSEFVVRLPALDHKPADGGQSSLPAPVTPRRILVVDDNVGAATVLAKMLTRFWQHEVETVHDGPAALTAVDRFQPEIILLDIGLPGMDGYEVARRLRQHAKMPPVLVVALTGYGQEEHRARSRDAGFDEHLVKPAAVQTLQTIFSHPKLATGRPNAVLR